VMGLIGGLIGGGSDFLFGESPSQDITPTTTLTPEQEELLRLLIGQITEGQGESPFGLDPSQIELSSLAGLESLVGQVPLGGTPGSEAAATTGVAGLEALQSIFQTGPRDIDEFFTQTIERPALESFREDIIPDIRTRFAPQFFGGERREAEGRATEDLIESLTRERARVGFEARDADLTRTLQGLSVLPGAAQTGAAGSLLGTQASANTLIGLLGAGGTQRNVTQQQLDERSRRIQEALGALGIEGFENIVFNNPGTPGFIPTAIGAAGAAGAGGAFSF